MQVATLTADRSVARIKYAEYLRATKQRHNHEYETIKNAYRELSKGNQVIDLRESIKNAGVDLENRPKLAIVRADKKFCWFHYRNGSPEFSSDQTRWIGRKNQSASIRIKLPVDTFGPAVQRLYEQKQLQYRALVPTIPPSLLPDGSLDRFFILWEADWEQVPVDPLLLKHLGGFLYRVEAAWDLTEVERSVLASRLTR